MDFRHLPVMYDYALWANARVLTAAEALEPEARHRSMGASFGSIHATMVHVASSEHLWLLRWQGQPPRERTVTVDDTPTLGELRRRWDEIANAFKTFLAGLEPGDWEKTVAYTTLDGAASGYPLWQMYLQVINHGTHHRAEAATMLTELGHPPEPLDMIFYFRALRDG